MAGILGMMLAWLAGPPALAAVRPPDHAREHWAFQPLRAVAVPEVHPLARVDHPIDRFLQDRLDRAGIVPAPPADPRTVIRRLSLDLTGLSP